MNAENEDRWNTRMYGYQCSVFRTNKEHAEEIESSRGASHYYPIVLAINNLYTG
jgi:hypothetical protein